MKIYSFLRWYHTDSGLSSSKSELENTTVKKKRSATSTGAESFSASSAPPPESHI